MQFALGGKTFDVTAEDVLEKTKGRTPEVVRSHGVRLGRTSYPVKQVVSLVTGISKADFNSHQARHILKRLGFDVFEGVGGKK